MSRNSKLPPPRNTGMVPVCLGLTVWVTTTRRLMILTLQPQYGIDYLARCCMYLRQHCTVLYKYVVTVSQVSGKYLRYPSRTPVVNC